MRSFKYLIVLLTVTLTWSCDQSMKVSVSGEMMTWHKVTLNIPAHYVSEQSTPNPFLDCRLQATFTNGEKTYVVPGYFAADGVAAETGAIKGQVWRVHFSPDAPGTWNYEISFRRGKNITLSDDLKAGEPMAMDGQKGSFEIMPSDKSGKDFRGKGRLQYVDDHHLRFAGTGEYFLKGGADSPENFLAYREFDGTYYGGNNQQRSGEDSPNKGLHAYKPHVADWKEGDPVWQDEKGKGIIGALNYLSSKGMNSVYFLTLNILGDGEDVWPYTDRNERYRFDCSKLDQWEIVFEHMEKLGLMMHVVLQETENEHMLDAGYLDVQRKLYLRELVARFAHHNAITWNLGEEHGPVGWMKYAQSVEDTKKMADYLRATDPYDHFIVMHTHPNPKNQEEYLQQYLGFESLNGPSIQAGNPFDAYRITKKWINETRGTDQPWVVCIDEIGPHWKGALPDKVDPAHDTIRKNVLWANLMAGGGGVEWYFGYKFPHADLNCEDWRSRDILWDQTRYALDFFQQHLPFQDMKNMDELVSNAYCLALEDEVYAVYYLNNTINPIDLRSATGNYAVQWYNPVSGGKLLNGTIKEIKGGAVSHPGYPEKEGLLHDWVCLLKKI